MSNIKKRALPFTFGVCFMKKLNSSDDVDGADVG